MYMVLPCSVPVPKAPVARRVSAGCAGHAEKGNWPRARYGACYSPLCSFCISEAERRISADLGEMLDK